MMSRVYIPRPPLAQFVELFWSFEDYQPSHARERVLPTGTTTLIIHLDQPHTHLYGAHSEFFTIDTTQPSSFLGVHFRPGGAFPFLGLPAVELHNSVVSLETLWGTKAAHLREQLSLSKTIRVKFQVLEKFFLNHLTCSKTQHRAVSFALKEFRQTQSISTVTDKLGLSSRRFSQVFSHEVGLTPKLFYRVQRFQNVLHLVETQSDLDWSEIALTCGYFDQAHFIHDFKAFSGFNPTTYLARRGERLNHLPISD